MKIEADVSFHWAAELPMAVDGQHIIHTAYIVRRSLFIAETDLAPRQPAGLPDFI
jgi:hypothetical protein